MLLIPLVDVVDHLWNRHLAAHELDVVSEGGTELTTGGIPVVLGFRLDDHSGPAGFQVKACLHPYSTVVLLMPYSEDR